MKARAYEVYTLPLPFILWFVTFRAPFFGFWPTITASSAALLVATIPRWGGLNFGVSLRQIGVGLLAAVLLYLFFWSGYQVARNLPGFTQTISSVYSLRGDVGTTQIAEVLLFPIGPAEELYWRGMIQGYLSKRIAPNTAVIITSVLYALIHLPTLNPSLILVALIGGIVWGYLYKRFGRMLPVLGSHILFDELIFVFLPIS